MKISQLGAVAALALAAGLAHAAPIGIDANTTDGSTFTFSGFGDRSFYIDLAAGTYSFSSQVTGKGTTDLQQVWVSKAGDEDPNGKNDFSSFTEVSANDFTDTTTLTLKTAGRLYVNVDAISAGHKNSGYQGSLTVSAVPEPASAALLLAGLGMMGFIARRRKS